MATLTIRDLDDEVKQRLRVRAAEKGVSMEAEARAILTEAVADKPAETGAEWLARARAIWAEIGYADDLIQYLPDRNEDETAYTSRRLPFVDDPEFDDTARDDSARGDPAREDDTTRDDTARGDATDGDTARTGTARDGTTRDDA